MSNKSNRLNTLNSLSVFSSLVEQILIHKKYAKIHSVFPNGFNLNFNDELVYVSAHQEGMLSARGLTIDKKVFELLHPYLTIGTQVRYRANQMVFYTRPRVFTIEFTDRVIKKLKIIPLSKEILIKSDLKNILEDMNLLEHSGFSMNQNLFHLYKDIHRIKTIKEEHIKQLIGSGLGLTPTGDDFLQGLIFTEQLLKNPPYIQKIVENQLKMRTTTDVSLSYYEAIFEGYGNEPLILLVEALKEASSSKIKKSLSLLQQYGETSGYDLLMGILTYLQIIIEDGMIY